MTTSSGFVDVFFAKAVHVFNLRIYSVDFGRTC